MASHTRNFMGAKLALFVGNRLLALQRDDRPGLLWPGFWDLPGGGRERAETPFDCAARETKEELSLTLQPSQICWSRAYTNSIGRAVWFFVAVMPESAVAEVRLGDEGQGWARFSTQEFLAHPKAVPQFQSRLRDYLNGVNADVFFGKTPR